MNELERRVAGGTGKPAKTYELPGGKLIYAGSYKIKPKECMGVKMAEEINAICNINIPVKDFSVPPDTGLVMRSAVRVLNGIFLDEEAWYVGCMGGVGRTGLFLSVLTKLLVAKEQVSQCTFVPVERGFMGWLNRAVFKRTGMELTTRALGRVDSNYTGYTAIIRVRSLYNPHAVETKEQIDWVCSVDVEPYVYDLKF